MIRTCKTQCKTSCCEPFSKLVIRLNDIARSANPNTQYLEIEILESVQDNKCKNETTYVFVYDENDLDDPTNLLQADEYFLICVQADFEYTVQAINAVAAPVIDPVDSESIDLNVTGTGHTLEANVIISNEVDNSTEVLSDGVYTPKIEVSSVSGDVKKGVGADYTIEEITETDLNKLNILGSAKKHHIIEEASINVEETNSAVLVPGANLNGFLALSNSITNPSDKLEMLVEEVFNFQRYSSAFVDVLPSFTGAVIFSPKRSVDAGSYVDFPYDHMSVNSTRIATTGSGGYISTNEAGPSHSVIHTIAPGATLNLSYLIDVELGAGNTATMVFLASTAQSILRGHSIY